MKIKSTATMYKRRARTVKPPDERLRLRGQPIDFWLADSKDNPIIKSIAAQWGDDLRSLPRIDAYYLMAWLVDEMIKLGGDRQPSDEAWQVYQQLPRLSQEERAWLIMAIMHRNQK